MSIERLQSHFGLTRMPFGRGLAPAMLHRHPGHAEAVARITCRSFGPMLDSLSRSCI